MPPRFRRPSPFLFAVAIGGLTLLVHGLIGSELLSPGRLAGSLGQLAEFLSQAVPPDTALLPRVAVATVETFEMALIGTVIGTVLSLPIALLAARNTSPHPIVYGVVRGLVAFMRAVPDLVWALIFIVAVGLGPPAGILAIAVEATGFCGRFFAERIEELDPGPAEALRATGSTAMGVIAGAVFPAAFPSFVATSLFALESGTRSAVVLGLVGAGGIGFELSTSMQLLRYDEALTIILVVFLVVVGVERISTAVRRRLL